VVVVRNKIDLLTGVEPHSIRFSEGPYHGNEVWLSAKSGEGVQLLANVLAETVKKENLSAHEGVLITNQRHWSALSAAAQALGAALQSLESGAANELAAFDVRESIATLSEITGEITSEDVLNSIFGHFCIGK
jgi:tRNA modification GTPase